MKKILIAVPELSYSGSVYSSLRIAKSLMDIYDVSILSYEDGDFRKEFVKHNFPVFCIDKNDIYNNPDIRRLLEDYDLLIANTIIVYALADYAKNIIPTIWYIREAQNLSWQFFRYDYKRYYALKRAENIYAVSEYAADYIKKINASVRVIHNCVEDVKSEFSPQCKSETIRFLMLGTLEPRKAFDIVINVVNSLPMDLCKKIHVDLAGRIMPYAKDYAEELIECIRKTDNCTYLGEIQDRKLLLQKMSDSDVIIVPSKDESCSLVALEGAMMGKPLILSENTGAKYLIEDGGGWLFKTDDEKDLAIKIESCIRNRNELETIGQVARKQYLKTSTFEKYKDNILQMVMSNIVDNIYLYRAEHEKKASEECEQRELEKKNMKPQYFFEVYPEDDQFVIYGAGEVGEAYASQCLIKDRQFQWVDSSSEKWGVELLGKRIEAPDCINVNDCKIYVAVYSEKTFEEISLNIRERFGEKIEVVWPKPELICK